MQQPQYIASDTRARLSRRDSEAMSCAERPASSADSGASDVCAVSSGSSAGVGLKKIQCIKPPNLYAARLIANLNLRSAFGSDSGPSVGLKHVARPACTDSPVRASLRMPLSSCSGTHAEDHVRSLPTGSGVYHDCQRHAKVLVFTKGTPCTLTATVLTARPQSCCQL